MKKLTNNVEAKDTEAELIPVSKWEDYFRYPTIGAIRKFIFYDTDNFREEVLRVIGKRQYIKVSKFYEWVEAIHHNTIA